MRQAAIAKLAFLTAPAGKGIGTRYRTSYLGGRPGPRRLKKKPHKQDSRHILDEAQGLQGGGNRGGICCPSEAVEDVRAVPAGRRLVVETRHDRQEVGGGPVARLEARRLRKHLSRETPVAFQKRLIALLPRRPE